MLAVALCLLLAAAAPALARDVVYDAPDSPLVSLILVVDTSQPAVGSVVGAAISSARAQTFPNLELVVVDEGIVSHSGIVPPQDMSWVRYEHLGSGWERGGDAGTRRAASLAFAVEAARGDILLLWDEWDISMPTRVQAQVDILAGNAGR